jgi:hypothetical protein
MLSIRPAAATEAAAITAIHNEARPARDTAARGSCWFHG